MTPKLARLAGFGALGAAAGLLLLILLIMFLLRPGQFAGMDWTNRILTWMSFAGLLSALAFVHILLGRRLLAASRDERPEP